LNLIRHINNTNSLQTFNLLRFSTFLIISIIFTKSSLSVADIGYYEMSLFIASLVSYFWVSGVIQSLLPLYNNNSTFRVIEINRKEKSPEIFNAFLLLTAFSVAAYVFCRIFQHAFHVFDGVEDIHFINLVFLYLLLSSPANLIEYIYLLRNKPGKIMVYGFITFSIQLVFVTLPVVLGYGIEYAIWGLIGVSVIRLFWLASLLKKYAQFRFSWEFVREHLHLGTPLILSSLLSGSAQYVDGLIVSTHFDARYFAWFRYGAKEFPLALLLANGLSNSMLSEFSTQKKLENSLAVLKRKSRRLMHILFPTTILLLFFAKPIYIYMFNPNFTRSADVFVVYLLLILSRIIFPQTILIGLKKTRIILGAAVIEIFLNVGLSLFLIQYYNIVGVALATVIVFVIEKIVLVAYNYFQLKIKPKEYIPLGIYFFYSTILITLFVLLDRGIIQIH
jgi:O-antigen/teichoic acid export membrane protein